MEHSLNHQPPISVKVCNFCALIAHGEVENLPSLLNKPQFIKILIIIYLFIIYYDIRFWRIHQIRAINTDFAAVSLSAFGDFHTVQKAYYPNLFYI